MTRSPVALFAIVAGAAILQIANGILGVNVPLRLGIIGYDTLAVGAVVTAYSIGFLAGCYAAPRFIRPVGHIRAFAALAAINAVAALTFVLTDQAPAWAVLRFIGGVCSSGLYTVIESWVADEASREDRGRVLASYMIINKIGLIGGQTLLTVPVADDGFFFLIACGAAAFCIVPVALARTGGPPTPEMTTLSIGELYRIAPVGVIGCVCAGLVNAPVMGLLPLYGLHAGIAATVIPLLVVAAQIGTMVFQWPLGWLSDRTDRRYVIVAITAGSAVTSVILAVVGNAPAWALMALFALWGGFALSLYAVCIAHASDFADPEQLVPLVSSLMLSWAVGSIVGPPVASLVMAGLGSEALLGYSAAISGALGLFALWRMTRRPPVPPGEREEFVNVPATSPVVGELAGIGAEEDRRG